MDSKKEKLKEAYDCLMFSQCHLQYAKYGDYMPLENMGEVQVDLRLVQQFLFYVVFAILSGALSAND